MSWPKYVILALEALSALLTITMVGKPRKPMTGGTAALAVVVTGLVAWLVVIA